MAHPIRWLKERAARLKQELWTLYLAYRHPQTPGTPKFCRVVIAYAVSPVDLIPDFIPVLGFLDDVLLLPAGICSAFASFPRMSGRSAENTVEGAQGADRQKVSGDGRSAHRRYLGFAAGCNSLGHTKVKARKGTI
jgi:uncharacterized membrane protein YkvA (DUF1232 family)